MKIKRDNKKIITVTFHRAENYGAVLQCYALHQVIKDKGCSASVLDLSDERPMYYPLKGSWRYLHRRVINNINLYRNRKTIIDRKNRFSCFVNEYIELTRKYSDIQELKNNPPQADAIIVGSDQVWNPEMYPKLVDLYRASFGIARKYSYAASFGAYNPSNDSAFWKAMCAFSEISVREKSAVKFFEEKEIKCRVDCDPVFLLSKNEWGLIGSDVIQEYQLPAKYILVFELMYRQDLNQIVKELKTRYSLPVIVLSTQLKAYTDGDLVIYDAGPKEFIGLISSATVVVSTSFHGAMFSLIFQKEIFAVPVVSSHRFESVFSELTISDHIVKIGDELPSKPIDYKNVSAKITSWKKCSNSFIDSIINE